jgi:hypothetical protein
MIAFVLLASLFLGVGAIILPLLIAHLRWLMSLPPLVSMAVMGLIIAASYPLMGWMAGRLVQLTAQ